MTIIKDLHVKKFLSCFILCAYVLMGWAQPVSEIDRQYAQMGTLLSPADEALLRGCPVLKLDAIQRTRDLPAAVDNSTLPFMTPIYHQSALECGQSSSIVYTFSYEINCRRGLENNNNTRRYPSHFAWNFCNGGTNRGVSFMDTWQVIRTAGTPTVAQWGGSYNFGGPTYWASGYNLYYQAMRNRIVEFYAIPTDTEEGILTLKHWLHNHLRGDAYGGLANFYSTHVPNGHEMLHQIPEGTPHAGMWIVPNFQNNVNHGQTIVGYDDSICWDYNGDGRYTNDVDLNHDGVIDIHDWEVGAVIFCNSFGTDFANAGYSYLPYRKLAELPAQGGIWNSCVYVVDVKDEVSPRLTYKATVSHTCRGRIKLMAGVAANVNAQRPDHTTEWAVFNFQGGEHYMQGDSTDTGRSLELGLDVSRLLEFLTPGQPAKFFFEVVENDPDDVSNGQVVSFSLMDYQGFLPTEIACTQTNVPIANNDTTFLSLVASVDFSRPQMFPNPPMMTAFQEYSYQIPASGGKEPYRFEFTKEFEIEEFTSAYPNVDGNDVALSNANTGYATVTLPFSFPFYGNDYDQICIYADGYITFRNNTYNWPFLQNTDYQVLNTEMIAPFRTDLTVSNLKVKSESEVVSIFVQAKQTNNASSAVNFTVKLYPDGMIEYYYGTMNYNGSDAISAVSRGDSRIFQRTDASEKTAAAVANRCFRFIPPHKPDFLTLSRDGVLAGTSTEAFTGKPVSVTCFDNNDQRHDTVLILNCEYDNMLTITDLQISAGEDDIINPGEEVELSFTVRNMDSLPYNDCNITFSIGNGHVQMMDNEEYFGYISGGNAYTLNRAIRFRVDENTPHLTILDFAVTITNDRYPQTNVLSFPVYSYQIEIQNFSISDGNNRRLDPDETDTLYVTFVNRSNLQATDVQFHLHFNEPDILLLDSRDDCYLLDANTSYLATFVFRPTATFSSLQVVDALIDVTVGATFYRTLSVPLVGDVNCEGFDDGLPETYEMGDSADWVRVSDVSVTGSYSMKSGVITHDQSSAMVLNFMALRSGQVSFFYKTSTENNYDWLNFYIDGQKVDRWSGLHDWTYVYYDVTAGEHTLMWQYAKDYSVNGNGDCVWIDEVCLPLENEAEPQLRITPAAVALTCGAEPEEVTLQYESVTPIYLLFENQIINENNNPIGWATLDCQSGSLNALASRNLNLTVNLAGMPDGIYRANLIATVEEGNTVTVPIEVTAINTGVVEYITENLYVKIYPNPTSSAITVELDRGGENGPMLCRLFDLSGRELRRFQVVEDKFYVDIEDFTSGIYLLHIQSADGLSRQVVKVVKR